MRHVYFRPKDFRSLGVVAGAHFPEEFHVLFDGSVSEGAFFSGELDGTSVCSDLFLGLVIDVGESLCDEVFSPEVELLEVVGGVELLSPLESEPLDVLLNGVDVFDVLLCWVRVVESEVCFPSVSLGEPEIDADGLCVSDV